MADDVCYWGDAQMLPHIFRLLGLRGLRAEVRFAERPIEFSSDVMHRKLAAIEARAAVAALGELESRGKIGHRPGLKTVRVPECCIHVVCG